MVTTKKYSGRCVHWPVLLLSFLCLTAPAEEKLALTPPMGWNSFDSYGVYLHEEAALANVDAMAEKLKPYGYEFFVIDNGWFGEYRLVPGTIFAAEKHASDVNIDEFGLLDPSNVYFPNGLKPVIDRCHEKGLKFGLHLMRGVPRKAAELDLPIKGTPYRASQIANKNPESNCTWCTYNYGIDMSKPGAQEFYNSLIKKMADIGVDFIKYDDIVPYPREVEAVAEAIKNSGRSIVLSLSPGDHVDPNHVDSFRTANMLRVTPDIWDRQKGINTCFKAWRKWGGYEQPGFWIDMDMIPFGRLQLMSPPGQSGDVMNKGDIALAGRGTVRTSQLTKDQMCTFITLRALAASPLMIGGDLPTLDDFSLKLLTDPQMLACNQNGVMGRLVLEKDTIEVWKTEQKDTKDAGWFGVFNRSDDEVTVTVPRELLQIPTSAKLQDVWNNRAFKFDEPRNIPANGIIFVRYE